MGGKEVSNHWFVVTTGQQQVGKLSIKMIGQISSLLGRVPGTLYLSAVGSRNTSRVLCSPPAVDRAVPYQNHPLRGCVSGVEEMVGTRSRTHLGSQCT